MVLRTIPVKLCIGWPVTGRFAKHLSLWKTSSSCCFFAQGGGFLLVKPKLVEKPSHIRGIKDGQSRMTRIILVSAGDGDLGRIIENRPEGAVFEY